MVNEKWRYAINVCQHKEQLKTMHSRLLDLIIVDLLGLVDCSIIFKLSTSCYWEWFGINNLIAWFFV